MRKVPFGMPLYKYNNGQNFIDLIPFLNNQNNFRNYKGRVVIPALAFAGVNLWVGIHPAYAEAMVGTAAAQQ